MFYLDEYVSHKLSGVAGRIVAYGHQMVDGVYQPTLRVRVTDSLTTSRLIFVEDLVSVWERVEKTIKLPI